MHPTDPSDAHLRDRAIEIRALKAGIVVFIVTFAALFYSLLVAFGVFVVAFVAYKYTYYTVRIGVFTTDDLAVRHNRLELGLLAVSVVSLGTLVAVQLIFPDHWTLGGFLSLPPIDLTDPTSLLADLAVPLAWVTVLAPIVAVSYAGIQLRHRLLFGLDSDGAVIRATVWESLARLPVYLLWVGVLTMRPIYEVWRPAVQLGEGLFGLTAGITGEFAVLLDGAFPGVVVGGLAAPVVVIASYLGIQRWKYDDATIPEVFGHPGITPPTRTSHRANVVVPVAVFLLYTLAVFVSLGSPPVGDLRLALATVVTVLVGSDYLGRTSILLRSTSERVAESIDATVTGLVVGLVTLGVLTLLVDARATFVELALTYPIVALPLAHLGSRIADTYAVDVIAEFVDSLEADPNAFDETAANRLFVYSEAWADFIRAPAIDGLVSVVKVSSYRRDDALDVFVRAIDSDDVAIVHAGLHGITAALDHDRAGDTYERLVDAGVRELVVSYLDSDNETTQAQATEAAARLFTIGLETASTELVDHLPGDSRLERMTAAVDRNPQDEALASAVVTYFARVWYEIAKSDEGDLEPTDDEAQHILGGLVRLAEYADDDARSTAVSAVTVDRAPADVERFSLATDRLGNESVAVRHLAVHVVRSSINRHADRIDPKQLLERLEDPSEPVRQAGARLIVSFVQLAPDRASGMLDRLVLHLEEHLDDPGLTEGHVIRALNVMDVDSLVDHPTAAPAVAGYVDETRPPIAEPAAEVLSSIVTQAPHVARDDAIGTAIETGLTNPSPDVRFDCLEAVVAIIDNSVDEGRRFVGGLCENLSTEGEHGELAAVCLAELFETFPDDGLDVLPALSTGLGNLTPVRRQAVPFVVRGSTVSAVTVDILVGVLPLDPSKGEVLIEPLTDVATTADGATLEGVFKLLAALSAEFPAECRSAVGTAAAVVEADRVGVRRVATKMLANVAAHYPVAVEPFVDRLVVATDDDSQRVRAAALSGLTNVCIASPAAIEPNFHRVVGLLNDDSPAVRERAARLTVVIAEREPEIVQPAAETADLLRRLQQDPAVDVDTKRLQDALTAIGTGVPIGEARKGGHDAEEIWSPETADEMGISGDTEIFVPGSDEFDAEFDDPLPSPDTTEPSDRAADEKGSRSADETPLEGGTSTGEEGMADVEDLETVIEKGGAKEESAKTRETRGDDVEDLETAIEPAEDTAEGIEEADTREDAGDDVADVDTVIDPDQDTPDGESKDDVEDAETVIESGEIPADELEPRGDIEDLETAIEPSRGSRAREGVETDVTDDVEDLETTIDSGEDAPQEEQPSGRRGDATEPADVEDLETAIEPDKDASESDDSDDRPTDS